MVVGVLTFFAGVLLEKQIVIGILSALVLSVIPLIRPYQWQSLLLPVLPNDMLEFLDAPVPVVVGIKNKTSEVQLKLTNVILVDANRNQVSLLLKDSFIHSFPYHDRSFMKLFVDTQLFSVHTDLILSFFQKE